MDVQGIELRRYIGTEPVADALRRMNGDRPSSFLPEDPVDDLLVAYLEMEHDTPVIGLYLGGPRGVLNAKPHRVWFSRLEPVQFLRLTQALPPPVL